MKMTGIADKIVRQVEYYFGDINIIKDDHLKKLITSSTDGYVSYEELVKFKKLASISTDAEIIKTAIQEAPEASIVEASEAGIRRKPDLTVPASMREAQDKYMDRSIYVKGFPIDTSLETIMEFFDSFAITTNVHMRRLRDNKFKGSVFTIFKTKEGAEKFLNDPNASKFHDLDLTRRWQSDYLKDKDVERAERREVVERRKKQIAESKEDAITARMTIGALLELTGFKFADDAGDKKETTASSAENNSSSDAKQTLVEQDADESDAKPADKDTGKTNGDATDAALKSRFDEKKHVDAIKEWIKTLLAPNSDEEGKQKGSSAATVSPQVGWVELKKDEGKAIVRFKTENSASEAWSQMCGPNSHTVEYQQAPITAQVLTGEEERKYWRHLLEERSHQPRRGTSRRARGGYGGDRGPAKKRMRY